MNDPDRRWREAMEFTWPKGWHNPEWAHVFATLRASLLLHQPTEDGRCASHVVGYNRKDGTLANAKWPCADAKNALAFIRAIQ